MTAAEAIYGFWSSFGVPAYEENAVPDGAGMPYLTYRYAEGAEFAVDVPEEGEPAVRIFVPGCPYTERMRIGEDLGAAFGVEVRVETGKEGGR